MKLQKALISFGLITFIYLAVLIWLDARNQVFVGLPETLQIFPMLVGLSFVSFILRYMRWYWLLYRIGSKVNLVSGFMAYLAGFAFTATPGKVGELIRIRYFSHQGLAPWKVIAAFVYERVFDLLVVLMLSALVINRKDLFVFALLFVGMIVAVLVFIVLKTTWLSKVSVYLRYYRFKKLARLCAVLGNGLNACRKWVTPLDIVIVMILGIAAWGVTSFAFLCLLNHLNVQIDSLSALAIYPLALLTGAASMLPGGIGSTEAVIIVLLTGLDVSVVMATIAAVGIRIATLWFAILLGLLSIVYLERHQQVSNQQ